MKCRVKLWYTNPIIKGNRKVNQVVILDSVIEASSLQEALPILQSQKGIKDDQVIRALTQKV